MGVAKITSDRHHRLLVPTGTTRATMARGKGGGTKTTKTSTGGGGRKETKEERRARLKSQEEAREVGHLLTWAVHSTQIADTYPLAML